MANVSLTPKYSSRTTHTHLEKLKLEARERKRNILYLILGYLKDNLFERTAETLKNEAQLDDRFQVCENVELDIILQEYQSYYYTKFQKYPKIIRKLDEDELKQITKTRRGKSATRRATATPAPPKEKSDSPSESDVDFQFEIVSLNDKTKLPKPKQFLPELEMNYSSETRDQLCQNSKEIVILETGVKWTDCLGLEHAIEILKECTLYPLYYPDIFKDMVPWKGVLLHGPPGTGKTLLAKALATEGHTTFFNVTNSTFISKWRGESEKMIKNLFDTAKKHAPSTIFFDEIDALVFGTKEIQHEASKRFRSELLVQLDGISSSEGQIFILASTNSPWDLDDAVLRRFDKRILVDMPNKEGRVQIFKHHLKNASLKMTQEEMGEFGNLTEQYSGSDMKNLSKEVSMMIVRERIRAVEKGGKNISTRAISYDDVKRALQKVRPSTSGPLCKKYYQWQNEHGAS